MITQTLLIVDDVKLNREILKKILSDEYNIEEAENGEQALSILIAAKRYYSAVLLDLVMPVMDGFAFLEKIRSDEKLSQIPVIVTTGQTEDTSEVKALKLGANDYVAKPYNPTVIKQRIHNAITLREKSVAVNELQRDRLTGLFNRETFFKSAEELVPAKEPGYYVMCCYNIEGFKVINDQYGTEIGDKVLKHVADSVKQFSDSVGGICCRIMADNFATLVKKDCIGKEEIQKKYEQIIAPPCISRTIGVRIGRFIVNDTSLSANGMFDRASLAAASLKGKYDKGIALYDESMRDLLLHNQTIVNEMNEALHDRQFEVWFQPQYNHASGALIGAEALVRWRHPVRGLIPPFEFIPVFEQNGFIYELDKFVWEETCRYLRRWLDDGKAPLPISVNISRNDIFHSDLVHVIAGLIQKYELTPDMLRLEITESAFAKSTEQIVSVVKELIDLGFTLEIDDFGSGYSSLNTLKNVPAQVVKLDMRFLDDSSDTKERGGNIIESVVRMTKWLGMSVIAEGVEDIQQADFLKSIGCNYIQGYLYAKPMPASDYEGYCRDSQKEEKLLVLETVENLNNNSFWNPKSMDTLIFNSFIGGACIFEYYNGKIELLRANDKYASVMGSAGMTIEIAQRLNWEEHLDEKNLSLVIESLKKSVQTGQEVTEEFVFTNLPGCPHETHLRSSVRVIASTGDRLLVYCTNENITAQRQAEQKEKEAEQKRHKTAEQLQAVMDNVNCGITAAAYNGENDVRYLLTNNKYYELLGYTKEQYDKEVGVHAFQRLYIEDRERVIHATKSILKTGKNTTIEYRAVKRDGSVIWLKSSISMSAFDGVEEKVQLSTYADVTSEKHAEQELLDNLPGGAALYEFDGKKIDVIHLNKRYWELVNRPPKDYSEVSILEAVYADDRKMILERLSSAIKNGIDVVCDIRVLNGEGGYSPFHVVGRIIPQKEGKYSIYASYTPISDEVMQYQRMLPIALATVINSSEDLAYVKDRNHKYICCSEGFAYYAGLASPTEIIGKTDFDLVDNESALRYLDVENEIINTKKSKLDYDELLPTKDNSTRYGSTSKYPLLDSSGDVIGIYGVTRDVTVYHTTYERLKLLTNSILGGIATFSLSENGRLRIEYFNDGFCALFNVDREKYEKFSELNPFHGVFNEDIPELKKHIYSMSKDEASVDCVYRVRLSSGEMKYINLKAQLSERKGKESLFNAVFFDVTKIQSVSEQLRISEEECRLALQHEGSTVCRYDVIKKTIVVPNTMKNNFALPAIIENVPYGPIKAGDISSETSDSYVHFFMRIENGEKTGTTRYQRRLSTGWRWLEAKFTTIFSDDGSPLSAVLSYSDVTEQIEKEKVYKKWQQSLSEKNPEAYTLYRCNISKNTSFDTAVGSLLYINFKSGEFNFDERTEEYIRECVYEEDKAVFRSFLNSDLMLASYYRGKRFNTIEFREKVPAGGYRWLSLSVDLVESPNSTDIEAYMMFENIDKDKRAELLTKERAETDPLTGVLNRTAFASKVEKLIYNSDEQSNHAMLMVDIDGFKLVNDAFGHSTGDQALIDIATSIKSVLQKEDLICRLGGDEFMVFLNNIQGDSVVMQKAERICSLIRKAYSIEVFISASIGIAMCPRDGSGFEILYEKSDAALYHVKGCGKDSFAFYHRGMEDEHFEVERFGRGVDVKAGHSKKRRMLIVDDSFMDFELLANIFREEFIVEKARDGASALIRLRHYGSAISVILLDLLMPGVDGYAVLEKMRESADLRSIPVVVVSSDDNRESSLKAIREGASDFVTKPVDPELLKIRVYSAISKAENERLRAKNTFLELQNDTTTCFKTVLDKRGIAVIEHDWIAGTFTYSTSISKQLLGFYDERKLWRIFLADMVADTLTVRKMQELEHKIATDKSVTEKSILVKLKTPEKKLHLFRMTIYKLLNELELTNKLIITFEDTEAGKNDTSVEKKI